MLTVKALAAVLGLEIDDGFADKQYAELASALLSVGDMTARSY